MNNLIIKKNSKTIGSFKKDTMCLKETFSPSLKINKQLVSSRKIAFLKKATPTEATK